MERAYKVIKITELTRPSNRGGVEKYYRHTIETRGGTVLSVDIDAEDFTPEKAAPILAKRATDADRILSG
ncbi:MAG: hypothetical protein M0R06_06510 [Sphaerochaeta sp.]|nr:hypothetical protein [Sphaerochaeta sp.]MDD4985136.1 hypothetical protein [Dehalococcoidales bacterium]